MTEDAQAGAATPDRPTPATYWVVPASPRVPIRFRSARTRARVAASLLALATLEAVFEAAHFFDGLSFLDRARAGIATRAEATAFDATTAQLALADLGILVVAGIAYLAWLSRSVDNLERMGLADQQPPASPRWAIGFWFVPIASWVMPYRIVADLYRRATTARDVGLVNVWWLAWLSQTFIAGYVYFALRSAAQGLDSINQQWALTTVAECVRAIAGVFAILVVLRIDAGMEEAARQSSGPAAPPAANDPAPTSASPDVPVEGGLPAG